MWIFFYFKNFLTLLLSCYLVINISNVSVDVLKLTLVDSVIF